MIFAESKTFSVTQGFIDLEKLAKDAGDYLVIHKNIEKAQYFQIDNGYLIQAKDPMFNVKGLLGLGKAVQFELVLNGNKLTVRVGYGDFIKSNIGTYVRTFVFVPLGLTAWVGMIKQAMLINEVFKYVEKYATNPSGIIDFITKSVAGEEAEDSDTPFILKVNEVLVVSGRPIATGKIESGSINVGNEIEILNTTGESKRDVVSNIEKNGAKADSAQKGDCVNICFKRISKIEIKAGDMLYTPNSLETHSGFFAAIYVYTKKQGSPNVPIFHESKYTIDMPFGKIEGELELDATNPILNPGEGAIAIITLSEPCVMCNGLEFYILNTGGQKLAHGVINEVGID